MIIFRNARPGAFLRDFAITGLLLLFVAGYALVSIHAILLDESISPSADMCPACTWALSLSTGGVPAVEVAVVFPTGRVLPPHCCPVCTGHLCMAFSIRAPPAA